MTYEAGEVLEVTSVRRTRCPPERRSSPRRRGPRRGPVSTRRREEALGLGPSRQSLQRRSLRVVVVVHVHFGKLARRSAKNSTKSLIMSCLFVEVVRPTGVVTPLARRRLGSGVHSGRTGRAARSRTGGLRNRRRRRRRRVRAATQNRVRRPDPRTAATNSKAGGAPRDARAIVTCSVA